MRHNKRKLLVFAVAAVVAVGSTVASADVWVQPATVSVPVAGGPFTFTVEYTEDTPTWAVQTDIPVDLTKVTFVSATPAADCAFIPKNPPGIPNDMVRVAATPVPPGPVPTGTLCTFAFTALAGAAGDTMPLVLTDSLFFASDYSDTSANHTLTNGEVEWTAGPPPDVVLTFNPAAAVAFGGGAPGANVNASITVGNTGTVGTGTVDNCVLSGPDAGAFTVTGGDPTTAPPGGTIGLQATLGAAALTAALDCDVADAGPDASHHWDLTAPAGTVLAPPTVGAPVVNVPNAHSGLNGSVSFPVTAPGDAGGPDATVECSVTSGDFTISPDPTTLTFPAGSSTSQAIGFSCNPQPTGAYTGTLSCTGAFAGDVGLTCPEFTAAPPPHLVPATSLWSKLALFGLFGALGMLILGLRRSH